MSLSAPIYSCSRRRAFTPRDLFATAGTAGGFWDATNTAHVWQDTGATTPATVGTVLSRVDDLSGGSAHMLQATATAVPYLRSNVVSSVLQAGAFTLGATFGAALGSNCTIGVAFAGGGCQIIEGQILGSTYTVSNANGLPIPWACAVVLNRPLSAPERIALRAYLYGRCGVSESTVMPHFTATGQSLSIGGVCAAVVDTTVHTPNFKMLTTASGVQPYGPRTHLDINPATTDSTIDVTKVPGTLEGLHEALIPSGTSANMGETTWTGLAAQFMYNNTTPQTYAVDCHGRGSASYRNYTAGYPWLGFDMIAGNTTVSAHAANGHVIQDYIRSAAEGAGSVYALSAMTNVHGEADAGTNQPGAQYTLDVQNWQASYLQHTRDGFQRLALPMFISQMSDLQYPGTTTIPFAQMNAHSVAGCRYVIGPKYDLPYVSGGIHLQAIGYRRLGEMFGKVMRKVLREGVQWSPLRPVSVTFTGPVCHILMQVPVAPLVIDTTLTSPIANYGITYTDSGGTIGVSSVALNADGVTIDVTLTGDPTANTGRTFTFAGTQSGTHAGPTTGARTNIHDSDSEVGVLTGFTLYNWCCISQVTF